MSNDFVRQLVAILGETPRTAWETRIRIVFGGSDHYVHRRPPEERHKINKLTETGIDPRKARRFVRGY